MSSFERERERTDLGDFKRSDPHDHNTDNKKQPSPVFQTHIYETKNHSVFLYYSISNSPF
jgi:hypothetical protein